MEEEEPTEVTVEDDFSSFGKKKKKKKPVIDIDEIKQDDGDGTTDDCKLLNRIESNLFPIIATTWQHSNYNKESQFEILTKLL